MWKKTFQVMVIFKKLFEKSQVHQSCEKEVKNWLSCDQYHVINEN